MKKIIALVVIMFIGLSFITISNANSTPTADFSWSPLTPNTQDTITFTDLSSNQSDIIDRTWYFGDGNGSIDKNPTHQYNEPGTYDVKLVVIWEISLITYVDVAEKEVVVENQPPVAIAGPNRVSQSKTVIFDGSESFDPDGVIVTFEWTFGDGTQSNGEIVQHTYANDGVYNVQLEVTDDFGDSDVDTLGLTVDSTYPVTTAVLNGTLGDNDWYTDDVTISFEVNETTSDINETFYRINGGNWTIYVDPFVIDDEGQHLLQFYSDDTAGNVEPIVNITIKIDKTDPSITFITPMEQRLYIFGRSILPTIGKTRIIGRITVEVAASDTNLASVKFYVNDVIQETVTNSPYEWRWGQSFGNKNLKAEAVDEAGLTDEVTIDVFILSIFQPRSDETPLD